MPLSPTPGTKMFIAEPGPLSPTPDWKEIGEIVNFGEFGRVYNEITHESVSNRAVRKFKGTYNDGNMPLQLGRVPEDDGQAMLQEALDSDDDYNFKIELNDTPVASGSTPTTITFEAKVMSYTTNLGGQQVVGANASISIQSGTIVETAAVDAAA